MDEKKSYWDLVHYAQANHMCFNVGCTTCGCMPLRNLLKSIGRDRLREMLSEVKEEDIIKQNNFDWHDILEIIIFDFGKDIAEGSTIYNEYLFVFKKFYENRRMYHMKPYEAMREVLKLLHERTIYD